MRLLLLLIILAGVIFWQNGGSIPIFSGSLTHLDAKRHAPAEPAQKPVSGYHTKSLNGYTLTLHHSFNIKALVLSKKNYTLDKESNIAPIDLALGWGPMSNPAPLKLIRITQSNRFYYFRYDNAPPIPQRQIELNSANMHIIPANRDIKQTLKNVRKGSVVHMTGYLVDARDKKGWRWNSSRTRDDTGDGACELFYVESIKIL